MTKTMILTIVIINLSQKLLNNYTSDETIWFASQLLSMVQLSAALMFLTAVIPYRRLFLKTIASMWCVSVLTDALIFPLWFYFPAAANYAHVVQAFLSVTAFLYICVKSYKHTESDTIRDGYVYQVRAIPRKPQDMILSIMYLRPFGGTGVVVNGQWYHFRRGRLERDDCDRIPLHKCVIVEARKAKRGDQESLDSRLGDKWSWTHNCVTTLHPLTIWHRFK